mmetsp:Transcript_62243/g.110694  ORF Transcript_62243/g.110694 Transcript_62243/m.110694 type:complete len:92 (+) Transcript_62243:172-447(+)
MGGGDLEHLTCIQDIRRLVLLLVNFLFASACQSPDASREACHSCCIRAGSRCWAHHSLGTSSASVEEPARRAMLVGHFDSLGRLDSSAQRT